ncbi:MAG: Asp23/Gls24 family envelope stress response protein, partial [Clostridia bacterium]
TSNSVDIAEFLGKKSQSKGVKIQIAEAATTVDIYLTVKYGCVIPSIAAAVQDAVANAIESMAGLSVTAVNVHVTGIAFDKVETKPEKKADKKAEKTEKTDAPKAE